MILVDTSAWVEFDRGTGSSADRRIADLISEGGGELATTEPVLMEVLAGARRESDAAQLRQLLTSYAWVSADPVADFEGAARIYRACRSKGITPRGLLDCMITAIAIRSGCQLLAHDRDFAAMATVVPLTLA